MTDPLVLAAVAVVVLVVLPGYLYVVSKFIQVGRMSGARWFARNSSRRNS